MKKAFSLAELLLVLAIISMVIGTMNFHAKRQRIQSAARNIVECAKIYESALTMYYLRTGDFPKNGHSKWIEKIAGLKPYLPVGFNTMKSLHSRYCNGLCVIDHGDDDSDLFGFNIVVLNDKVLIDEVLSLLKEFAVEDQLRTGSRDEEYCISFLLKTEDGQIFI